MAENNIHVILADDHAVVRAGIRQFLECDQSIQVVAEANNGIEAERLIEQHRPDVAVLDVQMPEASGIEVTRWIRAHASLCDTGVLVLTAYDEDAYVMAVLKSGANGYVLKTASPLEIIQAVRDVFEGKSAIHPEIARKVINFVMQPKNENGDGDGVLSEREMQVVQAMGRGLTNKAIAMQLGISDRTVQGHIAHIFVKLHVSNRTEAVMRAMALGWVSQSTTK